MIGNLSKSATLAVARTLHVARSALGRPHPEFTRIERVLSSGSSVIRWGDGETSLVLLKSITFQRASPRLALELCRILIRKEKQYVLCVPPHLERYSSLLGDRRYISLWATTILLWELLSWRVGRIVSDAYAFRNEGEGRALVLETLLTACNIHCVVSKSPNDAESISEFANRRVLHVQCPARNAYEQYGAMRNDLLAALRQLEQTSISSTSPSQKVAVLVSAGPAGKVLISELASSEEHANVQFIDVGHLFDHGIPACTSLT